MPQHPSEQRDALRAAGVDDAVNLYHDFASGLRDDRPGLDSCALQGNMVGNGPKIIIEGWCEAGPAARGR